MFYLFDEAGFMFGEFKTKAEAEAEMATFPDPDRMFISTDADPWGEADVADLEMGYDPYEGCYTWDC